jgi:hypothetical protein
LRHREGSEHGQLLQRFEERRVIDLPQPFDLPGRRQCGEFRVVRIARPVLRLKARKAGAKRCSQRRE